MRIDAHHHLWQYDALEYGWIDDNMSVLQRDYLSTELEREAAAAGVSATVAVQARQSLEETNWLLKLAAESNLIRGVVGWAPIATPEFQTFLDRMKTHPLLKGLRHVVQGEPEGFLLGDAFNAGIALMESSGLVYDLLIFAHQLEESVRFVDRHPRQQFVLDHIAKPAIASDGYRVWHDAIGELALRENVVCKLSGMVTEANWTEWTADHLKPYADRVLEVFGPNRLMVGTDWPVMTVACGYRQWWDVVEQWLMPLSISERRLVESEVAERIYRLDIPVALHKETA